jgi:hypothetical protein
MATYNKNDPDYYAHLGNYNPITERQKMNIPWDAGGDCTHEVVTGKTEVLVRSLQQEFTEIDNRLRRLEQITGLAEHGN